MSDPDQKESKETKPRTRANAAAGADDDASDVGAIASGSEGLPPSGIPPIHPPTDPKATCIDRFGEIISPAPLGKRAGNRRTKPDPPGQTLGRNTPRFELPLNSDEQDGDGHSAMSNRLAMGRTGAGWFPNTSVPVAADSRYRVRPSEVDLQFSDDEVEPDR